MNTLALNATFHVDFIGSSSTTVAGEFGHAHRRYGDNDSDHARKDRNGSGHE